MIKDIFGPDIFELPSREASSAQAPHIFAKRANARFRSWLSENGKKVYGIPENEDCSWYYKKRDGLHYHTGYLIGVEEIKKCEHPKEKVTHEKTYAFYKESFVCECGTRVEPSGFRAIDESDEVT